MRELDKSKVYDLSELTSEEYKELMTPFGFNQDIRAESLIHDHIMGWVLGIVSDNIETTNAKELFYTLENIQVDCSELSEDNILEMSKVFEYSGFKHYYSKAFALEQDSNCNHLKIGLSGEIILSNEYPDKTTITYEKFMELFGPTQKEYYVLKDFGNENTDWNEREWQNIGGAICFGNYHSGFKYGFNSGGEFFYMERPLTKIKHGQEVKKATNKEVVDMFIKEAKRRDWGVTDKYSFDFNENIFTYGDCEVFNKGIWTNLATWELDQKEAKPPHYSKGIDTFARMEANCTKEECLAFVKGNIDKYNFRDKGQDVEDLKKIIHYANWALKIHAEK